MKTSARNALLTPRMINERNRRFWRVHLKLRDERMSDNILLVIAIREMRSEIDREVSARSQKTLEQALADAEETKHTVQSNFSRKGGTTAKCDALQSLIREIVLKYPKITTRQLFHELKGARWAGTIVSIDEEDDVLADEARMIHFVNDKGRQKTSPLSGLKDRLFRARKKINSR
jgi:hypothetical protein